MIIEHILNEFSFWLRIDKSRVETIIDSVNQTGYMSIPDLRQLSEVGIPIVQTIASVLETNNKRVFELLSKEEYRITYQDLLLLLGIIASDFKDRYLLQKKRNQQLGTENNLNEVIRRIQATFGADLDFASLNKIIRPTQDMAYRLYDYIREMEVYCGKDKIEKRVKQSNEPFYYRFDKNKKSK